MAGCNTCSNDMVPYSRRMVSQPFTVPGTETDHALSLGMWLSPVRVTSSMAAAAGARPLALRATTRRSFASQMSEKRSPPTPVDIGSTTLRAAAVATAASTALPPAIIIRSPAIAASGWLVATIPCLA